MRCLFAVFAALAFGTACATVKPSMTYYSTHAVERIPLKVALDVTVAPLNEPSPAGLGGYAMDLRRGDEERLAETLRDSLAIDLENNGPFTIDDRAPEARLKVHVPRYIAYPSPGLGWLILDSMLLGVPILFGSPVSGADLEAEAIGTLIDVASGSTLIEVKSYATCSKLSGLYYNYSITMECVAQPMMEQLRDKLVRDKVKILAALESAKTAKPAEPQLLAAMSSVAVGTIAQAPRVVIAVFDVEDTAKKLEKDSSSQLTEYLAARVTEVLGYRVVPREQLRKQLQAEKSGTYKSCFEESCQIELGKAVAAKKSMATKVIRIGSTCAITSTIYDLESETTERAATAKTECSEDAMIGAADQVVAQLKGAR